MAKQKTDQIKGFRDENAPNCLTAEVRDSTGTLWGLITLDAKNFSTGSVGFYGNGKLTNPANPLARYQAGFTCTLVGSKS